VRGWAGGTTPSDTRIRHPPEAPGKDMVVEYPSGLTHGMGMPDAPALPPSPNPGRPLDQVGRQGCEVGGVGVPRGQGGNGMWSGGGTTCPPAPTHGCPAPQPIRSVDKGYRKFEVLVLCGGCAIV